jgi:hypothetical protein
MAADRAAGAAVGREALEAASYATIFPRLKNLHPGLQMTTLQRGTHILRRGIQRPDVLGSGQPGAANPASWERLGDHHVQKGVRGEIRV